jgi:hypothetical protein
MGSGMNSEEQLEAVGKAFDLQRMLLEKWANGYYGEVHKAQMDLLDTLQPKVEAAIA